MRLRMMRRIGRRLNAEGVFAGQDAGFIMDVGADSAEALDEQTGVPGIAPLQDGFDPAPEGNAAPSVLDRVVVV